MATPTIRYYPQKFRGPTSSTEYNEFCKRLLEDIGSSYNEIAEHTTEREESNYLLTMQLIYLQNQYQTLLANYEAMDSIIAGLTNTSSSTTTVYLSYYNANLISYGGFASYPALSTSEQAQVDTFYGILTPYSYSSTSRIFLADSVTGTTYIPDSMNNYYTTDDGTIVIRASDRSYNSITVKPISRAVDGSTDTYWYIEARYPNPSAIMEFEIMLDIPLPVGTINSYDCNYIIVEPFPYFSTSIENIYYTEDSRSVILSDAVSNTNADGITSFSSSIASWTSIPINTPTIFTKRNYDSKIVFPQTSMRGFRTHLKTDNYTVDGGEKVFTIGLRSLDCGYSRYSTGSALTKFELPSASIERVYDPSSINTSDNIEYKLWYDQGFGDITEYNWNTQLPIGINKVYIETILSPSSSLYGINLQYKTY